MPRLQDLKLKYLTIQPDNITDNGLTINGNADFNSNVSISSDLNVTGNTTITGDLTVKGTTTTIESVTTVYQDPILQIGGTTAPTTDDIQDRGISFFYYDGAAKTGFMGYDDSADGFTFLKEAIIDSEVVTGNLATLQTSGILATSSTFDLDCSGAMSLNSSAGVINIGDDVVTQNINIGSGASARTIQIGNAASTATNIDALAINLTSVDALSLTDGIATLSLGGTGATALVAATTVDLDCSGDMSLNSSAGVINIGDDVVAQNINIGTQGERIISIGTGAFADTINIGNATGATTVSITAGTAGIPIISDTATTNNAVSISADALTTGSALDISATNASLTGPVINITGGSDTANGYNAFTPIYQQINSVQRGNIKFSWTASATNSEVDVGVDLPFPTGVCVVTDIFIITTNATSTPTITLGLLSSETNGDADGFLVDVTQTATGVQSVYTNAFKGAFNTDSGDNIPTRWNCPFHAEDAQSRSISMTLSATGSVGTIIMEYIGMDV